MCTHMKSSLPSLLDAYLPPRLKKQGDQGQQTNPHKRDPSKYKRLPPLDEDEDENDDEDVGNVKATRKALREQHYLEIYKDMYRLCKALRLHYKDLLSKKVQKQRQEIKERDLHFQQKSEKQKIGRNSTRPMLGHQSEFCPLRHDIEYLKSVPKSHSYMIVEVQDQLVKSGILKNQEDYEHFWRLLKQNSRSHFETKLQDVKLKMNRSPPYSKTRHVQQQAEGPRVGRMKINLSTDSELPGLPTLHHATHPKSKQRKVHEESEQIFPKVKNLKQMQEAPHHEEVQFDVLYQMYNRSIANVAISQRLLKRSGHFAEFKEPTVQDFVFCHENYITEKEIQSRRKRSNSFPSRNELDICEKPNPKSFESHDQDASEEMKAE
ncbi:uncharacterized protein si:ch211-130h14.4 [Leucoraja erinacea]|uniref:uncharacterized protein si:ch211-130h14.4 n=1 Tax=Leucoraja erinaceus TaxID=7782 RepID=UPI0024563A8F|nr:uncharacterized protein si:ch211-130h14.4 [Leucoraja erinacea]